MKHISYFLISPRPVLIDRLKMPGAESLGDLCAPIMWSGAEHDRGVLLHTDVELLTKLLFLDVLGRERQANKAFSFVFGDLSISAEYFDRLWIIERVRVDMSVEDAISDAIETGTVQTVIEHGNERIKKVIFAYAERRGAKSP